MIKDLQVIRNPDINTWDILLDIATKLNEQKIDYILNIDNPNPVFDELVFKTNLNKTGKHITKSTYRDFRDFPPSKKLAMVTTFQGLAEDQTFLKMRNYMLQFHFINWVFIPITIDDQSMYTPLYPCEKLNTEKDKVLYKYLKQYKKSTLP